MLREIANLDELNQYARELLAGFDGRRLLILLDGPMGAGKTQLTRFLLDIMNGSGGGDTVTSPSFAIHNHYDTPMGAVEHVDLYRIDNKDDLESTGFWDLFLQDGIVIIEWSDRLKDWDVFSSLPRNWPLIKLRFEIGSVGEATSGAASGTASGATGEAGTVRHILEQKSAGKRAR